MPYTMPGKKRPLGGGSVPSAPGGGATSPAAPAGQPAAPGYVNFSRLLAVNQGGAQKMADNLAGQVQQKGQAAAGQIESARAGFQGKVQGGALQYQAPNHTSTPGGATSGDLYRTAGAMKEQAARGYSGPKDWAGAGYDVAGMASSAKSAQDSAKNLTTSGGRGAMLREGASGPYSAGMSALDAGLSGAALGNRGQELSQLYGGLSQQLVDYQRQGGDAVEAATTQSNDAARQYGEQAERFQTLGDQSKESEEQARRYREEYLRRNPRLAPGYHSTTKPITIDGRPIDPRLLTPGLYG
jgi:hypothetical protein